MHAAPSLPFLRFHFTDSIDFPFPPPEALLFRELFWQTRLFPETPRRQAGARCRTELWQENNKADGNRTSVS